MSQELTKPDIYWSKQTLATYGDMQAQIQFALGELERVKQLAVVPVSQFRVAAIVFDERGNAYAGINQEYAGAAMAQTVHAEQSAVMHAWSRGAKAIKHVVVNYPPCGHCRQFLNELRGSEDMMVHLPEAQNLALKGLLPHDFSPADLDMPWRLLDDLQTKLACLEDSSAETDELAQAAVSAAQRSYAPYSKAYAGVALKCTGIDDILTGSYAENAAYNPSLPPLQAALNSLHLRGLGVMAVEGAAIARVAGHGQAAHALSLWQVLSDMPMQHIALRYS